MPKKNSPKASSPKKSPLKRGTKSRSRSAERVVSRPSPKEEKKAKHWNNKTANEEEEDSDDSTEKPYEGNGDQEVQCRYCGKIFACYQAYGGHKSRIHPSKVPSEKVKKRDSRADKRELFRIAKEWYFNDYHVTGRPINRYTIRCLKERLMNGERP
jgi:hypothetical protein